MKIFDYFSRSKVTPTKVSVLPTREDTGDAISGNEAMLLNVINELKGRLGEIDNNFDEITGTDYRVYTISDWLNAMRSADQPWKGGYRSNWSMLFDIFANMMQDTHVQGAVDTLLEGLQSKDFYIVDETGERLDDVTEMFNSKWFYDFLEEVLKARLWGFGLIQLEKFDPATLDINVREINRDHVRPDLNGVVKQKYDNKAIAEWDKEPFKTWTIFLYEAKLGKLNPCVRWFIYKTEIARFWAKYNQMYGTPPVIVKTALKDGTRKQNAINMLKKWQLTKWIVADEGDSIEGFKTDGGANGQQFFENLIRLADEQISKGLLGSTMVLDSGSSRSQSETHSENTEKFIKSTARLAKFTADKKLIPRLRKIGFPIPDGARLVWDNSEKMNMKERAEIVTSLNATYKIDTGVASEFVGIDLEEREEPEQFGANNPITGAIEDYKKRLSDGSN